MDIINSAPSHSRVSERRNSVAQTGAGWQQQLREAITDADTLFDVLDLPRAWLPAARQASKLFALRVPRAFVNRMQRGDIHDPLLRQILPLDAEHADTPGFTADAVGDNASITGDGLLHKYHGRALVMTTGACAVNCRYCFRRHFDYADNNAARAQWRGVIDRIAADTSIKEVILSGGDPLSLTDRKLAGLTEALADMHHVQRIRFHSRLPVVLPARIDDAFMDFLAGIPRRRIFVIHANHPAELDDAVAATVARMHDAGVLVLNQSVLLKGVNDDADVLAELSDRLFDIGVMPYYLHLLDRVTGTAHFEVSPAQAQTLIADVAARLPGYLVPRLARETPGAPSKSVMGYGISNTDQA